MTTRTGRFFHLDEQCGNLRTAKRPIRTNNPDINLLACALCVRQNDDVQNKPYSSTVIIKSHPIDSNNAVDLQLHKERNTSDMNESAMQQKKSLIVTRTGRFFHMDRDCQNFRSARRIYFVDAVGKDLNPCYLCIDESVHSPGCRSPPSRSTTYTCDDSSTMPGKPLNTATAALRRLESAWTYYITRTGRFFHADVQCQNLRYARRTFPLFHIPPSLKPCYLCV